MPGSRGWNTLTAARRSASPRTSVAWPPAFATMSRIRSAPPKLRHINGQPDQTAAPVGKGLRSLEVQEFLHHRRPRRRRNRDLPDDTGVFRRGERPHIADRLPQAAGSRAVQFLGLPLFLEHPAQGGTTILDRRARPLQAQRGNAPARIADKVDIDRRRQSRRQPGRAGNIVGRVQSGSQNRHRRLRIVGIDQDRACLLRHRQDFHCDLRHDRQGPPGSGHQLAKVVAGHILHDPPAGLEDLAPARNRLEPQEMVPRRARLDPAGTAEIGRNHTGQSARSLGPSEQRPEVGRLERQFLIVGLQGVFNLGHGRSGAGLQDQFIGFIECDPGKLPQIDGMLRAGNPAQRRFRAGADNPQRRRFRHCPGHGFLYLGQSFGCKYRHCSARFRQNRGMSGNGICPLWMCMRPSSAQRCSVGNTLPGFNRPSGSNAHFKRC